MSLYRINSPRDRADSMMNSSAQSFASMQKDPYQNEEDKSFAGGLKNTIAGGVSGMMLANNFMPGTVSSLMGSIGGALGGGAASGALGAGAAAATGGALAAGAGGAASGALGAAGATAAGAASAASSGAAAGSVAGPAGAALGFGVGALVGLLNYL